MFSASRSRRVSIVAIIQSFAQLEKNYGREGSAIIIDNCQDTVFGGFAPNSESAQILSKAMGSKTVMSGSVNRGKNDPSQSLQMIERPLMTPDELKSMPKGHFIVTKTGEYPMRTRLKLFTEWGITFGKPYEIAEQSAREVEYADRRRVEEEIILRHSASQETTRASLLIKRAIKIADEKPVSAISYLGRSLIDLYKEESKHELILCLVLYCIVPRGCWMPLGCTKL